MDQGPLCYISKFIEIGPLVPKKIFNAFYHIWTKKPSGHVTNIILTYVSFPCTKKAYIQNLVKKGQAVSEKNKFNFDM